MARIQILTLSTLILLAACVNGPCRKMKYAETPVAGVSSGVKENGVNEGAALVGRVFVSQPDGSLQCGMNPGISLTEMEKQLVGIKVYSREKKPDGKMHIQVCGSPTGILNVYEIPEASLAEAERRGFRKFNP